jgi:hypothetical protein
MLFAFYAIERGQLLAATAFLVSFGEVVLVTTGYCGQVLEQHIKGRETT